MATVTVINASGNAGTDYDVEMESDCQVIKPIPKVASAATISTVNDTASSTTLLASNANRLGAVFVNDSTVVLYLKFGTTASTSSYTYRLDPYATLEIPGPNQPLYTGTIDGIWASDASGKVVVTELT